MKQTRLIGLLTSILILLVLVVQPSFKVQALPETVYDSLPNPLPYNLASLGFQATQTSEFGDYIHLAGTNRNLQSVTVMMSIWAKNSEYPSMPSTGFTHPITINIYNAVPASPLNTLGSLVATITETKTIPWRPEADPTCPGGTAWRAPDTVCYNGLAFNLTFDMSSLNVTLPDDIIIGVAYNTQTYGAAPLGVTGPYNSLNVAVQAGPASVGTDDDLDRVFWDTSTAGWYSDGGAGGVGIFREDTNWVPYGNIPFQVIANPPPAPAVLVDPVSLAFGDQEINTSSAAQTVTVTNVGNADLNIGTLNFTSDWILSNDTCSGAVVTQGNTCTFDVAFHPLALGPLTGSIGIPSDAASSPDSVALSGTGVTPTTTTLYFRSIGANDGTLRESSETSGFANFKESTNQLINVGDDQLKRQYKGILDFDTSSIPDNAVITGATLQIRGMVLSTNVYAKLGNLVADMTNPYFGTSTALQFQDFRLRAKATNVGTFTRTTTFYKWMTLKVNNASLFAVNKTGHTQFRVRFTIDDSNDAIKDMLRFLSGDYYYAAGRPRLIITYYIP